MRVVIVGGVAGGMSCAARLRRLAEDAEIVVLERGRDVSFANCGLPYHVGEEIPDRDALLLHTPESLRATLDLDVRTGHEVRAVDLVSRTVRVADGDHGYDLTYDALVLSPGARPVRPPIPGLDLPGVHTLRTLTDADAVRAAVADGARRAVVLGAGFIGLEAVEALHQRGLHVDLVELGDQVLPPLDPELATLLADELRGHGVGVHTGLAATGIHRADPTADHRLEVHLGDGQRLPADLVLVSVGVRPDSTLAGDAGLALGPTGAIRVDASQRTSDPHVWAVGDATEVVNAVTGASAPVPLAGPANRAGRVAADSILGRGARSAPVLGTAIVRVFGLTAAVTGSGPRALSRAGITHHVARVHPGHRAGYLPGAEPLHLLVTFGEDGLLLGAQAVGRAGVDKRIDVLATALRAGMGVDDLAELELAYAPPYGSAKDPVNMAGFVGQNILDGTLDQWHPDQLEQAMADSLVLDVRSDAEFRTGHLPGALHVPHTEVRRHLDAVRVAAQGRSVRVYCAKGFRGYLAHRVLTHAGLDSANLSGGMETLLAARPGLELARLTEATS